jgi:hypothetical protein
MARKKKTLTDAEIAQAVADVAEQAERGGRNSGIRIGERRFHLEGRQRAQRAQRMQMLCQLTHLQRLQRGQRSSQLRLHRVAAPHAHELR